MSGGVARALDEFCVREARAVPPGHVVAGGLAGAATTVCAALVAAAKAAPERDNPKSTEYVQVELHAAILYGA